jgi:hypothetical protein
MQARPGHLHRQTGQPPSAPPLLVNYGVFDSKAAFTTPSGWNQTVTLAGGGDQTFQPITLGGLTGDQSTSTYVNIADSGFAAWVDTPVLDVLLQVQPPFFISNCVSITATNVTQVGLGPLPSWPPTWLPVRGLMW